MKICQLIKKIGLLAPCPAGKRNNPGTCTDNFLNRVQVKPTSLNKLRTEQVLLDHIDYEP